MSDAGNQNQARTRFVLWFSGMGALLPVICWAVFVFAAWINWDWTNWPGFLIIISVACPAISMLPLDLDLNWNQVVLVISFVVVLNSIWYGAIGFVIWNFRNRQGHAPDSLLRP